MYEVSDKIIQEIKARDNQLTSNIIEFLISEHSDEHDRLIKRYDRYKQDNDNGAVPILSRKKPKVTKINNKIPTDWAGSIVDTKLGYFMGKPITTKLEKKDYLIENPAFKDDPVKNPEFILDEKRYAKDNQQITTFNKMNSYFNQDRKIAKFASATGLGARLLYIKQDTTDVFIKNINPWEVIFIRDRSTGEILGAIRYYSVKDILFTDSKSVTTTRTRVEWYNKTDITFYLSDGNGHYQLDESEKLVEGDTSIPTSTITHMFNGVPLLPLYNNEEVFSDYEKSLAWMDDWDSQTSDVSNTLQEIAQEILITAGFTIDDEMAIAMRDSGSLAIGDKENIIKWLEKNIKIEANEKHLARAKEMIITTAKHIDINEAAFGGNIPIIGIHFKIFNLECKSTDIEAYFEEMLTEQYKLLTEYWSRAKQVTIDYLSIDFIFTRNIPVNTGEEAETAGKEKGILSDETILANLSKVDDVEKELQRIENEKRQAIDAEDGFDLDDETLGGAGIETPTDIEAEAKAKLKGTVGGVQGILEIQKSVSEGITSREAAIVILGEIFGFDPVVAGKILGSV